MNEKQFGAIILSLRKEKKLTQEELAHRLNVTPQAVSKWELGGNFPDLFLIPNIATIFGVTTDYLLGREERRTSENDEVLRYKSLMEIAIVEKEHSFEKVDSLYLEPCKDVYDIFPSKDSITRVVVKGDPIYHTFNEMSIENGILCIKTDLQNQEHNLTNYVAVDNDRQNRVIIYLPEEARNMLTVNLSNGIVKSQVPHLNKCSLNMYDCGGIINIMDANEIDATIKSDSGGIIHSENVGMLNCSIAKKGVIHCRNAENVIVHNVGGVSDDRGSSGGVRIEKIANSDFGVSVEFSKFNISRKDKKPIEFDDYTMHSITTTDDNCEITFGRTGKDETGTLTLKLEESEA